MKISAKLILGFSTLIVFFIVMVFISRNSMENIDLKVKELTQDRIPKITEVNNIKNNINLQARAIRNIIIFNDSETTQKEQGRITDARASISNSIQKLDSSIQSKEGRLLFSDLMGKREKFLAKADKVIEMQLAMNHEGAKQIMITELRKVQQDYFDAIDKLINYQQVLIDKSSQLAEEVYESGVTVLYSIALAALLIAILISVWIILSITKPLTIAVNAANSIAVGNLNIDLSTKKNDETGKLLKAMKTMTASIKDLTVETESLIESANSGNLDHRGNAVNFKGIWNELILGINKLVDSFVGPINLTAEYVDRISKGDIPPKITDEYKGDYNEIKNNLNQCIDSVNLLINETVYLSNAAVEGKLFNRADTDVHNGAYKRIVAGMNSTIDSLVGILDNIPAPVMIVNTSFEVLYMNIAGASLNNTTGESLFKSKTKCFDHFRTSDCKTQNCACGAAMSTDNIAKSQTDAHPGNYNLEIEYTGVPMRDIEGNVIGALEIVVDQTSIKKSFALAKKIADYQETETLKVTENLTKISKGIMDVKAESGVADNDTEDVKVKFDTINNALNQCVFSINNLVADTGILAKAAAEGKLDRRADASKHEGDFKIIIEGINKTLDNVIGPLNVAAEYVDRISKGDIPPKISDEYKGDFNEIKNNLNKCIDSINLLVTDTLMLVEASSKGNRNLRADKSKHSMVYKNIIEGFNDTLDGITKPFNLLIEDLVYISEACGNGVLDYRGDTSKHEGEFREVLNGVNGILDNLIKPLNVAAKYVDMISKGNIPPKIEEEYKGGFNEIKVNLNQCIDAVNVLVTDVVMLAEAAAEGNLGTRADVSKHSGEYKAIVEGFNNTLDYVLDPINEGSRVLEVMATGDLSARMTGDYKGGHAKMKESINTLGDSLSSLISQVLEMTQNVSSIALQMSSTAETMAAGSQEQAAQADDVSSAVEEMSRTITENAMAAHKTVEEAEKNKNIAREGGTVVEQTVQKMKDIAGVVSQSASNMEKLGDSSTRIGEIISVIDDIADQTNLLALNAAIEAARAGEQGRGFAVVADEVRKLAERTTEATKQIADMIKGIQNETLNAVKVMNVGNQEVTNGIQLADQAGKSLKVIVDSSQEVQMMINQIAAASEEQSSTSDEIAKNVQSINQVTNESAKRIQDIAESSDNLARMIESLGNLLRQFKVSNSGSVEKMQVLGNGSGKKKSKQYLESNY